MTLRLQEYTTEQLGGIAVIVTVITVIAWFQSDLTGLGRATSTGFAFLAAIVGVLVGLWLFDWRE